MLTTTAYEHSVMFDTYHFRTLPNILLTGVSKKPVRERV